MSLQEVRAVRGRSGGDLGGKIAVRAPNWIGDGVMALPALGDLAATFPGQPIHVHAVPAVAQVLSRASLPLRIEVLDRSLGSVRMLRAAIGSIRAERFSLGLVLPPSFSSALLFRLGRVGTTLGYACQGRSMLLTHALRPVPRGSLHLAEEYRALVPVAAEAAGAPSHVRAPTPRLSAGAEETERAATLAGRGEGPLVVIAPGAVYGATKRWPPQSFAELCDRLARSCGARVVLTGTNSDREACAAVARAAASGPIDLSGRTDMGTLVALFAGADLVVSNDSGAMHVAAAAGAPVVAIFGSTNPRWTAPEASGARVIWREEPCSPCYRRHCPIGIVCLTRIGVETVFDACRESLEDVAGRTRS